MKTLIYFPVNGLKPIGGPAGYLYNLNKGLINNNIKDIEFLNSDPNLETGIVGKVLHGLPSNIKNKLKKFKKKDFEVEYQNLLFGESKLPDNFNDYDVIHFHTTFDLFKERKKLESYKGIVALNSHCPIPYHQEYIVNFQNSNNKEKYFNQMKEADAFAFNRADLIIFPCQEAEESYINKWEEYKEIHKRNSEKYRYLITGICQCEPKKKKASVRNKYNIPEDAFLICYTGRHNSEKGYDVLLELGHSILEKNDNTYIIVAGSEGPLYGLKDKKWIEVGWTDDPHSIMKSADVFVLPNKDTYFDLIMLEALSLGLPVITSYTGGNKYFEKFKDKGIKYFYRVESLKEEINNLKNNPLELDKMGSSNLNLFKEYFNENIFAKNYIQLLNDYVNKE